VGTARADGTPRGFPFRWLGHRPNMSVGRSGHDRPAAGYPGAMVLVFYKPRERKQGTAGEDTAGSAGAVCVVSQPDHVLVLVAPITTAGTVLEEEGQGFALWGGEATELGDPPGIQAFFLRWRKEIRPSGAEEIRVIDFRSGQQIGEAVRDARGGYDICEFEGRLSTAVKGAAIDTVTGALLGTVTPGSGTTSLDTTISALDKLEKLFEQRGILLISSKPPRGRLPSMQGSVSSPRRLASSPKRRSATCSARKMRQTARRPPSCWTGPRSWHTPRLVPSLRA
jgi:hypothetical protein